MTIDQKTADALMLLTDIYSSKATMSMGKSTGWKGAWNDLVRLYAEAFDMGRLDAEKHLEAVLHL